MRLKAELGATERQLFASPSGLFKLLSLKKTVSLKSPACAIFFLPLASPPARHRSTHYTLSTYLLFRFLGDDAEPVSNHTEHGGKVRQAHHDPETHHRLVIVQEFWIL